MSKRCALAASAGLLVLLTVSAPASAQRRDWDLQEQQRYENCLGLIETDPDLAYETAIAWQFESGGPPARHCVASALIALGQYEEGAARLESAAAAPDAGSIDVRAAMLHQAGQAWLSANAPAEAERALTYGLSIAPGNPDLLVERALARGLQHEWAEAVQDLTISLTRRDQDVQALRLRAEANLQLGRYDEADEDVEAALAIDPEDIETLVVRGRAIEARRTGQAPDNVRLPADASE